jgi:hypothetical protein
MKSQSIVGGRTLTFRERVSRLNEAGERFRPDWHHVRFFRQFDPLTAGIPELVFDSNKNVLNTAEEMR